MYRLIIDVGNTNIKYGFFKDNHLVKVFSVFTKDFKPLKLPKRLQAIHDVYLASVAPSYNDMIIKDLNRYYDKPIQVITSDWFKPYFDLKSFSKKEMGVDILGFALNICQSAPKATGICFGTATFAIMINYREIYGVAIAPSITMGITNLTHTTELIKEPHCSQNMQSTFGKNTKTAVAAGAWHMTMGFVNSVMMHAYNRYRIDTTYVTGGKLNWIPDIKKMSKVIYVEHAVLKGYQLLVERHQLLGHK